MAKKIKRRVVRAFLSVLNLLLLISVVQRLLTSAVKTKYCFGAPNVDSHQHAYHDNYGNLDPVEQKANCCESPYNNFLLTHQFPQGSEPSFNFKIKFSKWYLVERSRSFLLNKFRQVFRAKPSRKTLILASHIYSTVLRI